jgi:regulator of sirC expression with transglutaminase-like and TPR domain
MRSMRTPSLGFAMPVNVLKVVLEKPNPMPMARWQTIGALDVRLWQTSGANWTQRAGQIRASGRGPGFGGRALCLWQHDPPAETYDVAVRVKLDDERGAAGLAFCSDGADQHYGFYPTNGSLRLTRFDGPDVFSWKVLEEIRTPHYREGEWNDLRVRVEPERLTCFLNGEKIIESADTACRGGKAGLCKFRDTAPAFRQFQLAASLDAPGAEGEHDMLLRQAKSLEENARHLRELARRAHQATVERQLVAALGGQSEPDIDLIHAALLIARLDDPELDPSPYRERIRRLADEFRASLGEAATTLDTHQKLDRLDDFFFRQNGFHGARFDYENRANSHLNEVLDDREGLPITLCVLYMEIGRAANLNIVGVPRPGQFVVRCVPPAPEAAILIDVFDGGTRLDEPLTAALEAATKRQIVIRMLQNLRNFSLGDEKSGDALAYSNLIVALSPDDPRERLSRAWLSAWEKNWDVARRDADWLQQRQLEDSEEINLERLLRLLNDHEGAPAK